MRIKCLHLVVCFILYFTEHAYFGMRISACVFFTQRIKYRQGMRIFQAFVNNFFLRCGVTRLLKVVLVLLAFKNFNLGSVLTKIKTFYFYTRVINFFCNQFWDLFFLEVFTKLLKLGLKYLINGRFSSSV